MHDLIELWLTVTITTLITGLLSVLCIFVVETLIGLVTLHAPRHEWSAGLFLATMAALMAETALFFWLAAQ